MDKFIYIYSNIYQFHHEYVSKCLTHGNVSYQAIKIDDIGKSRESSHTFAGGVPVKLELLLKSIENNIGRDIVFSDVTIGFNPAKITLLKEYFNQYREYDLCWQYNNKPNTGFNIGITKVKCNTKMLDFFHVVRDTLLKDKRWDQDICNQIYTQNASNINFKAFSDKIVANGGFILNDEQIREEFYIWKQLTAHKNKTPEEIVELRVSQLKLHQLLI